MNDETIINIRVILNIIIKISVMNSNINYRALNIFVCFKLVCELASLFNKINFDIRRVYKLHENSN